MDCTEQIAKSRASCNMHCREGRGVPSKRKAIKISLSSVSFWRLPFGAVLGRRVSMGLCGRLPAARARLARAKCRREAAGLIGGPHGFQTAIKCPSWVCLRVYGRCTGAACNSGSGGPHPDTQECSMESGSNPANTRRGHTPPTTATSAGPGASMWLSAPAPRSWGTSAARGKAPIRPH